MLPKSDIKADTVIGMGQHIPAKAESRKVITYFLYSTVSGLLGEKCEPHSTKQHTGENRQRNRAEKTERIYSKLKRSGVSSPR